MTLCPVSKAGDNRRTAAGTVEFPLQMDPDPAPGKGSANEGQ